MQKITPCLWFDSQAEQAAKFYVSIFKNSKMGAITRYGEGMPRPKGSVMTVWFTLDGQDFMALNGGPEFKFTPAISLMAMCKTQAEIDRTWTKLLAGGGQEVECGWLTDKYGLSWQVVPASLEKLLTKSPAQCQRVMAEVMKMKKLDIKTLEMAAARKS
jgi:predicted 3-demethylubiquinone-9 3-methyltransferase (glyoxalase superfamily)